ncbi:FG-GAP repeat domain-containing protein [Planctomycetes bacterium Pan216]|uniref:FG-GAP repeat domain-containing protein n=1 Tax=Kolteria novifilia TaxID=2527975 RepID=UPI0011AB011C
MSLEHLEDRYVPATDIGIDIEPPVAAQEGFVDFEHYFAPGDQGTVEVVDVNAATLNGLRQVLPYGDHTIPIPDVADIDGDGRLEVVVVPLSTHHEEFVGQDDARAWIYDYESLAAGSADPEASFVLYEGYRGGVVGFELFDFDGDGTEEIAVVAGNAGVVRHLKVFSFQGGVPLELLSTNPFGDYQGIVRLTAVEQVEPTGEAAPLWVTADVTEDVDGAFVTLYTDSVEITEGVVTNRWLAELDAPLLLTDTYVSDPNRDGVNDLVQVFLSDETDPLSSMPLAYQPNGTPLTAAETANLDQVFALLDAEIETRLGSALERMNLRHIELVANDVIAITVPARFEGDEVGRFAMLLNLNLAEPIPVPEITLFERYI